jgi:hypothetical protein
LNNASSNDLALLLLLGDISSHGTTVDPACLLPPIALHIIVVDKKKKKKKKKNKKNHTNG